MHFVISCSVLTLTWLILKCSHSTLLASWDLARSFACVACEPLQRGGSDGSPPLSPCPPVPAPPSLFPQGGASEDHPGLPRPRSMLHVAVGSHPWPMAPPSPGLAPSQSPSCSLSTAHAVHPAMLPGLGHLDPPFPLLLYASLPWPLPIRPHRPMSFLTLLPADGSHSPPRLRDLLCFIPS